jgi:hypothetical protein
MLPLGGRRMFQRLPRRNNQFQPTICVLEDRTVPSGFRNFAPPPPVPGPATHLIVQTPATIKVDVAFNLVVVAEDAKNRIATSYRGTVNLSDSVLGDLLPKDYTFTAADHGRHVFHITLKSMGLQSLTVIDTNTLMGQKQINVQGSSVTQFTTPPPVTTPTGPALDNFLAGQTLTPPYVGPMLVTSYQYVSTPFGLAAYPVTYVAPMWW